jgi:hypothetical protein
VLQLVQLGCQLAVAGQNLAETNEGANDQDAHLDGLRRVEH